MADRLLAAFARYVETGSGDVKRLHGVADYRLRVGDWRIRFRRNVTEGWVEVLRVSHRSNAYRT